MYLGNDTSVRFTAEVEIEGFSKGNLEYELKNINIGHKKTYNLKFQSCGAYLGPNKTNFRRFMCCNLGTDCFDRIIDSNVSWNTTAGNRYAWGKKQIVYEQSGNPYDSGNIWKESENPCPAGYRVPTLAEFESALKNNRLEKKRDGRGNLIGWKVGNDLILFYYGSGDYRTYIWTTDVIGSGGAFTIYVRDSRAEKYRDRKNYGQSVRCIKKLPNE